MASTQVEKQVHEQLIANMKNQTPSEMHCERYIKFTKTGPGPLPPPAIEPEQQVTFPPAIEPGKQKTFHVVPKGAIVYTGHNKENCPTSWLTAWDTSAHMTHMPHKAHKVFVACGLKKVIEKMTDLEILVCLDEATKPEAHATDLITKTTVSANLGEGTLPKSILNANFGLLGN